MPYFVQKDTVKTVWNCIQGQTQDPVASVPKPCCIRLPVYTVACIPPDLFLQLFSVVDTVKGRIFSIAIGGFCIS